MGFPTDDDAMRQSVTVPYEVSHIRCGSLGILQVTPMPSQSACEFPAF